MSSSSSLDILFDIFSTYQEFFISYSTYKNLIITHVFPCLNIILKTVSDDCISASKVSLLNPGFQVTRIFRLARCIVLNYFNDGTLREVQNIFEILLKCLIPEQGLELRLNFLVDESGNLKSEDYINPINNIQGIASGLVAGAGGLASSVAGSFISRLGVIKSGSTSQKQQFPSNFVNFLTIQYKTSENITLSYIPSLIVAMSLEILLSFFMSEKLIWDIITSFQEGDNLIASLMTKTLKSISFLFDSSLFSDVFLHNFENAIKSSQLITAFEGFLLNFFTH